MEMKVIKEHKAWCQSQLNYIILPIGTILSKIQYWPAMNKWSAKIGVFYVDFDRSKTQGEINGEIPSD